MHHVQYEVNMILKKCKSWLKNVKNIFFIWFYIKMVLEIVAKFHFSKIRFSEANIHSNFKGIQFNSIRLINNSYKFASFRFIDFSSFQTRFQFAFNSLSMCFQFALHSLPIRFTFASNSFHIRFWNMQNICHMWTNLLANNIDPDSLVQTAWHAGASLNKWHMVLGIVAKSCFSKIRFSEANIHSNFKGIRFNSIHRFQFV